MDEKERQQLEAAHEVATHQAAALHNLGWERGAGATIWARAVRNELALHDEARERWSAGTRGLEVWEQLHATALTIVVAIDQILSYERRVRRLSGDAELARARERVDAICRDANDLRDLIAHLDEYAVGEGWRQTGRSEQPQLGDKYLSTFLYWSDGGGTMINLGGHTMNLHMAAEVTTDLAPIVERVRAKGLERVEQQANAAFRRLWIDG